MASPPRKKKKKARGGAPDDGCQREGKCTFWLQKKNRFCNFNSVPGAKFCGNHGGAPLNRKRIPCPIDPSHTIYEDEVAKHVKKCNATRLRRALESKPYFSLNQNIGPEKDGFQDVASKRRREYALSLSASDLVALVGRVHECVSELIAASSLRSTEEPSFLCPEDCSPWFGDGEFGPEKAKQTGNTRKHKARHVAQQASIIGHLDRFGITKASAVGQAPSPASPSLVELGAGKGYLGSMAVQSKNLRHLVLVDNQSFKHKADREIKYEEDYTVERIQCDLKDFDLSKLESLRSKEEEDEAVGGKKRVIVVGKHLCGGATDMALEVCGTVSQGGAGGSGAGGCPSFEGLGIASCCHHRCTWRAFAAKEVFESLGFDAKDFQLISWMTGWACCGHDAPEEEELKKKEEEDEGKDKVFGMFTKRERTGAGVACKRLIDLARLSALKARGFDIDFIKYCPRAMTGENMLLLAK